LHQLTKILFVTQNQSKLLQLLGITRDSRSAPRQF